MLVPFLIMLREGVEAALIVGIVAGYLRQTGRGAAMHLVWLGVAAAVLLSLAFGIALELMSAELPQKLQELFEAGVGLFAVVVLTAMVFWMRRAARSIKAELHDSIDHALAGDGRQSLALVALAFFAVAREGLESVLFLLAAFQQRDEVGIEALAGAVLGLAVAVGIGMAIYRGGRRLNLARFFRWTGVLILFVAAGLLAGAVRSLHEAGLWNGLQAIAFDLSAALPKDGVLGTLLSGLFGYHDTPAIGEVLAYFLFLIPALVLFLRGGRPAVVPQSAGAASSQSISEVS
ncbi:MULTISPECIES: iron uptake transporter permease EfeU [Rhodopseudomonas]|uniref:Iron transporter n=1 Tax=Rhodopseudomonas palustris TaxID=1076 RepID=A0A0D7F389_RHOPL|nr:MULTISPECIES: iron uptake transporter permease EfeU [Rhodopseudomonas]KIZ47245.1 iron transporter [Rhodopseudomonas palustris]MDF3811566.1 FTR1 family protein [Rhodopseudomonas sp. BAL398]WOK19392.1 iron uptake transporter permease EfeU [Rhodopseudomonas sp. BAL398]